MENTLTQSGFGSARNDTQHYGVADEAIAKRVIKIRNPIQKFNAFCKRQQENRLGWSVITLALQVFVLVPITLIAINLNGNRFVLWLPVILSSFVIAVSNLATLPTKITIPMFCTSVLINVAVIVLSFLL